VLDSYNLDMSEKRLWTIADWRHFVLLNLQEKDVNPSYAKRILLRYSEYRLNITKNIDMHFVEAFQ